MTPSFKVIHLLRKGNNTLSEIFRFCLSFGMSLSGYVKYFGNNRPVIPEDTRGHRLGSSIYNPSASTEPPQHGSGYTSTPEPTDDVSSGPPFGIPVIAVMGPTGSGKSTLISRLASQSVRIGHNLVSCECFPLTTKARTNRHRLWQVPLSQKKCAARSETKLWCS